ncbi:radical SAM protein [Stenotrophomonas sp. NPDC087984]
MSTARNRLKFAWLEVTGFCNEFCDHCYADSSPKGTHGTMTVRDWTNVIDQLSGMGAQDVQFIGGEPDVVPEPPGTDQARARGRAVRRSVLQHVPHQG